MPIAQERTGAGSAAQPDSRPAPGRRFAQPAGTGALRGRGERRYRVRRSAPPGAAALGAGNELPARTRRHRRCGGDHRSGDGARADGAIPQLGLAGFDARAARVFHAGRGLSPASHRAAGRFHGARSTRAQSASRGFCPPALASRTRPVPPAREGKLTRATNDVGHRDASRMAATWRLRCSCPTPWPTGCLARRPSRSIARAAWDRSSESRRTEARECTASGVLRMKALAAGLLLIVSPLFPPGPDRSGDRCQAGCRQSSRTRISGKRPAGCIPSAACPRYVISDQKAIWTSPVHTAKSDLKWWAIFGGATAALIATDRWTVKQLPNSQFAGLGVHLGIAIRIGLLGDSDQRRLLFHRHRAPRRTFSRDGADRLRNPDRRQPGGGGDSSW